MIIFKKYKISIRLHYKSTNMSKTWRQKSSIPHPRSLCLKGTFDSISVMGKGNWGWYLVFGWGTVKKSFRVPKNFNCLLTNNFICCLERCISVVYLRTHLLVNTQVSNSVKDNDGTLSQARVIHPIGLVLIC